MKNLNIGILYLGLHNQLVKKYGSNKIIERRILITKLGKHYILPKGIRPLIIKEMVSKNLLEVIDRDKLKILPFNIDIETQANELFKMFSR